MSDFHFVRLPPDSTGKRSSQTAALELEFVNGTAGINVGDTITTPSGISGDVIKVEGNTNIGEFYLALNHGSKTFAVNGEDILAEGAKVAEANGIGVDFYHQDVVLVGGNNPFNQVKVSALGALYTQSPTGVNLYDAFGKLQTSESTTIREYQPIYGLLADDFEDYTVGDASITWDNQRHVVQLQTGTGLGDQARRRSHMYHKYQTGVATTVMFSMFVGDSGKAGVHRKVGLYDDDDGVYFHAMEDSPEGFGCVVRSSVTGSVIETHYHQNAWNIDRLDGSNDALNVSGISLDPTKIQVMFIDFQWLGGGRIRFGFVMDGEAIVCHEINNANNIANPYMRTGSLPLTMEQYNSSAPSSPSYLYNVSAAIKCEGKYEPREYLSSGSLPPAVDVPVSSDEEYVFIGAVRPVKHIAIGDKASITDATISVSHGEPGTITSQALNLSLTFEPGDLLQLSGGSRNDGVIYTVDTVEDAIPSTITLTNDSPPILNDPTPQTITITSKEKYPNRVVGQLLDITLSDVSGNNHPMMIEIIKNAPLASSSTGIATFDTLVGGTGYIDGKVYTLTGSVNGAHASVQVSAPAGIVTGIDIITHGDKYQVGETMSIVGGDNNATFDIATVALHDYTWVDAYPGNMLDAAKPSTGVTGAPYTGNTLYTTIIQGTKTLDLSNHFSSRGELMFRKANLDDEPDNYTVRVKMFDPTHVAKVAFSISWKEIR